MDALDGSKYSVYQLPLIVIFFFCQNAFLNGIQTTSGIK